VLDQLPSPRSTFHAAIVTDPSTVLIAAHVTFGPYPSEA